MRLRIRDKIPSVTTANGTKHYGQKLIAVPHKKAEEAHLNE
jgi:hypothetical protein